MLLCKVKVKQRWKGIRLRKKRFVMGNWKMHGDIQSLQEFQKINQQNYSGLEVVLFLPATLLALAQQMRCIYGLGGQDCHFADFGAYTGDISAKMLADVGAGYVLLGHSERRLGHGETSAQIALKVQAAWRAGLHVVLCVGETLQQKEKGQFKEVLAQQLYDSLNDNINFDKLSIAYEPVWAIGTGVTAAAKDIHSTHQFLDDCLQHKFGAQAGKIALLYGGSVKPENAAEISHIENVDGALVGGASLKAEDFTKICNFFT